MAEITKAQYEYALERIEELFPYVGNDVPMDDRHMIEMESCRTSYVVTKRYIPQLGSTRFRVGSQVLNGIAYLKACLDVAS